MNGETAQRKLFAALDAARSSGRVQNAVEIARHAREAGLGLTEALTAVRKHACPYYGSADGALEGALASLVCSLAAGQKASRVLEYTADNRLMAAELAETGRSELSVFARDAELAEALSILLADTPATVSSGMPVIPADKRFDAIICAPPIGIRTKGGDGFGSEVVPGLAPALADDGVLCWITGRGVLFSRGARGTFPALSQLGLHVAAVIDLAPGALAGAHIEGTLIVFSRREQKQKLVGALRAPEDVASIISALKAGPVKKPGAVWAWLTADDPRSFMHLERERLIRNLTPRGRHELKTIRALLADTRVERADRPLLDDFRGTALLFVPEYAGSRVTADLEEQTVKPRSVYRLIIDGKQANPRFLAQLLNSPYGRQLRSGIASGATIQRAGVDALLSLELAVPDLATQERIARIDSDIGLLQAAFRDMQAALEQDWTALAETAERVDALKAVLDIEQRIADWWRELPYPLATIYRRYQVATEPKERLETLLHFFEMFAVYLAAVGASHAKALRRDWPDVLAKWLHPAGSAGIERTDFGFWIGLAGASLKDTARIASDKELRAVAIETGGPELVQVASTLGGLGKATEFLDVARRFRNSWKGHGGHLKVSDAERLDHELQQQVRNLYEATSSLLRSVQLVRPGMAEVTDTGLRYKVDLLSGSDPTFKARQVELDRPVKSGALAFWGINGRTMCRALPLFRLGAPQQPQESSFYVFNRVENGGFRWICYQEAREQEFVAPDEELRGIIALGKGAE
ncbi:restriction endonuclease subunit S [Acidiphilium sp. JA12-A1]|uniref:restriction endonuclease subunit S n=1 Tax=Acidiphilium sp. JA12-A1 TaxID=1464546 RepID=UPI000461CB92|nr:restriction endonuclease subunit S [Acidiphilium sp. JA12-A1]KDM67350.1 type I restriction-modification system methyltransferase subunit [Acidiphilium sp. JA12-A1]